MAGNFVNIPTVPLNKGVEGEAAGGIGLFSLRLPGMIIKKIKKDV